MSDKPRHQTWTMLATGFVIGNTFITVGVYAGCCVVFVAILGLIRFHAFASWMAGQLSTVRAILRHQQGRG